MRARKVASSWRYSLSPTIGDCTVALGGGGGVVLGSLS